MKYVWTATTAFNHSNSYIEGDVDSNVPSYRHDSYISIIVFDNHKTEHPFGDLLRGDWQSLRQRCAQKEKNKTKKIKQKQKAEHKTKITSVYRATDRVWFSFYQERLCDLQC